MRAGRAYIALLLTLLPLAVRADEFAPDDEAVEQRVEWIEDELARLRSELDRRPEPQPAPRTWPRMPFARSEYPTVDWSGFLQLDSGWIAQSDRNAAAVGSASGQTGLRRVRLRAGGDVREHTSYIVDLDFAASGHPSFRDVVVEFDEVPWLQKVRVGYFKQPFSMDGESSGQELLLLERQLPFAFAPFRQTGVATVGAFDGDRGTYGLSGFVFPTNSFGVNDGTSGGWSLASRTTWLLVDRGEDQLVHVGGGYSFSNPSDNTVEFSIQPGFFVTDPSDTDPSGVPVFVDTGPIPTNVFHVFNAEFALQEGPFRLQSEVRYALVDRRFGGDAVGFSGAYVQVGCVLTGESPDYDRRRGIFHRVIPRSEFSLRGGTGAVELTLGWSTINLNDEDVQGGRMHSFVVGTNWYLHEHAKIVFNVVPQILVTPGVGHSNAVVFAGRVQVSF